MVMAALLSLLCWQEAEVSAQAQEEDFYQVQTVALPEEIELEVGGLLPLPDDQLLVCTRRGEIWHINAASSKEPTFTLWTDGLQEPLGLWQQGEWVYTATRGALMRIRDQDRDGRADDFEVVNDDWDISGSYHEYNFGPRPDAEGNWWITTNRAFGEESFGHKPWRGWAIRIQEGQPMEPMVAGLRSPAGLEQSPWGDMFYTDNQGEWCGASKLAVLRKGDYHGHPFGIQSAVLPQSRVRYPGENPDGMLMPEVSEYIPHFQLPAVWFPYDKMGRSPSGMAWDTQKSMGPFAGQLFVGDQYQASVMRVTLEQIDGVWQGACYPFRKGLAAGVIRVSQAHDGGLWIGMSDRGWPSLGQEGFGLQKLSWNGIMPFEIREMKVEPKGFRLFLTKAVERKRFAASPPSMQIESYTYELHSAYGSDEMDRKVLEIGALQLSEDGMELFIPTSNLREGYVHELHVQDLFAQEGESLLHAEAYYTLQRIPR